MIVTNMIVLYSLLQLTVSVFVTVSFFLSIISFLCLIYILKSNQIKLNQVNVISGKDSS